MNADNPFAAACLAPWTLRQVSKHGLTIILDRSEVYPDDPGAGTPAIVTKDSNTDFTATLACAQGEGELTDDRGFYTLTTAQVAWLNSQEVQDLEDWVYGD